jgi:hypothetical protein
MNTRWVGNTRTLVSFALMTTLVGCGGGGDGKTDQPTSPEGAGGGGTELLAAPAAGEGIQIAAPEFVLHPGDEVFRCFYTSIPSDTDVDVARFVSRMNPGSHHFILYQLSTSSQPDGTLTDCGRGAGSPVGDGSSLSNIPIWVYASSSQQGQMSMPAGVGMPFKAHQPVMLNMHYFNVSTEDLTARVVVNLEFASGPVQKAGSFVSFNTSINVPANGTQTVSGHCATPAGAQFFLMSTHTHSHAVQATINKYVDGQVGELLVQTDDWEHPTVAHYDPTFMTFATNEELYYSCTYQNDTAQAITVGQSALKNEMCMAVTYYFPATTRGFCF